MVATSVNLGSERKQFQTALVVDPEERHIPVAAEDPDDPGHGRGLPRLGLARHQQMQHSRPRSRHHEPRATSAATDINHTDGPSRRGVASTPFVHLHYLGQLIERRFGGDGQDVIEEDSEAAERGALGLEVKVDRVDPGQLCRQGGERCCELGEGPIGGWARR